MEGHCEMGPCQLQANLPSGVSPGTQTDRCYKSLDTQISQTPEGSNLDHSLGHTPEGSSMALSLGHTLETGSFILFSSTVCVKSTQTVEIPIC